MGKKMSRYIYRKIRELGKRAWGENSTEKNQIPGGKKLEKTRNGVRLIHD